MEISKILQQTQDDDTGVNGMANLGNTCYLNSAMQCLMKVQPLTDYFLNGLHVEEINFDNKLGTGGKISEAFGDLLM